MEGLFSRGIFRPRRLCAGPPPWYTTDRLSILEVARIMSKRIIIFAETGSDVTPELAQQLGVTLIPMHVSMGGESRDDGAFPPEEV